MWGYWNRDQYRVSEWKVPKVNMDKGKRPICDKVSVEYSLKRKQLEVLREKYDKKHKHFDLWWPNWRIERTKSVPNPSTSNHNESNDPNKMTKPKPRRRHSARYSRHYLSPSIAEKRSKRELRWIATAKSHKNKKDKSREQVTMNEINYKEMALLVYGYIREQMNDFMEDLVKLIILKCEVLETFDGIRERKILRHAAGTMTSMCGNIYRKIECLDNKDHGYNDGVRYISINFTNGGCTNDFGITNKMEYVQKYEDMFPEIVKVKDVREYKMSFQDYNGGGIVTIKLDCDNWRVTFYKNYTEKMKEEDIKRNQSYWFYMYYCNRARQLFEIVKTDVDKIEQFEK